MLERLIEGTTASMYLRVTFIEFTFDKLPPLRCVTNQVSLIVMEACDPGQIQIVL